MKGEKEIVGLDLIDEKPDYTKSFQENEVIRVEKLKKLKENLYPNECNKMNIE